MYGRFFENFIKAWKIGLVTYKKHVKSSTAPTKVIVCVSKNSGKIGSNLTEVLMEASFCFFFVQSCKIHSIVQLIVIPSFRKSQILQNSA